MSSDEAAIKALLEHVFWHDAFVREIHVLSESFVTGRAIAAFGALPDVKCLICSTDGEIPAVEFRFVEVERMGLSFATELTPTVEFQNGRVLWQFQRDRDALLVCKELSFRILQKSACGEHTRYATDK